MMIDSDFALGSLFAHPLFFVTSLPPALGEELMTQVNERELWKYLQ